MANISNYLMQGILNQALRGIAFTWPGTLYLALHTADPTPAGSGAEVSTVDTGYARVAITCNTSNWNAPTPNGLAYLVTNALQFAFANATAAWGTITHWSLWSASTSGNMFFYGALTNARPVLSGDQGPIVPIGIAGIQVG